jgi:hypothetical protein
VVAQAIAAIRVKVSGTHATVTAGSSGIPPQCALTLARGSWKFASAPPSIES